MLSLPHEVLDQALILLVEGITGLSYETLDQEKPSAQLSQKGEALHFVLQAFNSHTQNHILSIHRQINELLPVYKLPDELLQQIFLDACDEEENVPRYYAPTTLAAVSSRWRSVAISYPRLWSSLHSDLDLEVTRLMLQRSKSAPLHIFCSCKNKTKAEKFFDLLNPLSARWRSLEFNYNNIDRLSLDFLAGRSFPLLEQLTLPDIAGRSRSIVFNAFNLDIIAPSIKLLQAPEYPLALRLDQGIHTRLTSLCFTASIDSTTFLPTDYYTLLSSTPYLQHLVIKGFRNADAPDPAVTTPLRIDLPYLELLSLRSLRYKTIGFLLSSIVKPQNNCHRVNVGGNPCGTLFTMFSLPPLAEDSLLAEICHPIEATLLSLGASFGVHTNAGLRDDGKHLLSLISSDSSDSPAEDLSTIMTMLFSSIRKLEIDGLELMLHGLGGKFHLLPRLEEIKFHSDEQDDYQECQDALEQIITVMASRSPPGQSSQAICPLLRHIVLDTFHFDLNRLVELVLVRTDMDGESKDKGRLELVELGVEFDLEDPTMQLLHDLSTTRNFDLRIGVLSEW